MIRILTLVIATLILSGCTEVEFASHIAKNAMGGPATTTQKGAFKVGKPYQIQGKTYYPKESYDLVETGIASWYGPGFQGKPTASGERFDTNELTAAHRTLQMPSLVRVTNLDNGKSVIVRVNDRGPFSRGRVIDVSERAASLLGFKNAGTAKVKLEVLSQESLQLAEMAKRGESTKGIELAANQGKMLARESTIIVETAPPPYQTAAYEPSQAGSNIGVQAVSSEPLGPIPVHTAADGRFMPDPVVTQVAIRPSNIYVQAGSFTLYENAKRLSQTLNQIASTNVQEATINGKKFYRVRVGPAANVGAADSLLNRVIAMGNGNAIIVVD
ncbi:MAG: septal ring lytic transglycosylase RlpA family protein [Micavibrio sp.]